MRGREVRAGHAMHYRVHHPKAHKKAAVRKHHAMKVHTRKIPHSRIFNMPDEQMAEPPVTPKDERRYWH